MRSYRLVTLPRSPILLLLVLSGATLFALLFPVIAASCGWWGDGEMDRVDDAILIAADGHPVTRRPADEQDPGYESMTLRANALMEEGGAHPIEIARLYLTAAAGGFPPAQNNLGNLYEQGLGVAKNEVQAAYWYRRAADQSEPRAQHSLGAMYLLGRGVSKDLDKGLRWLQRSAVQGHAAACADLANLYWQGEVLPRNKTRALAWWLVAAGSGDGKSADLSSEAKRQMRKAEIAAAEEMARKGMRDAR